MKGFLDKDRIDTIERAYNQGLYVEWFHGKTDVFKYSLTQWVFGIHSVVGMECKRICSFNVKSVTVSGCDSTLVIKTDEGIEFRFDAMELEEPCDMDEENER